MVRSLYTAALGMDTQMQRMDVTANNIANISTTGYKRDVAVTKSFSDEMLVRLGDTGGSTSNEIGNINPGVYVDEVYTDFSQGPIITTGGSLDIAIDGDGFFAISTIDEAGNEVEKYTRDGSFVLSSDGTLVTNSGDKVMGQNGPIVLPPDELFTITSDGSVYSNGVYVDTLKVVSFEDNQTLVKDDKGLYTARYDAVQTDFTGSIEQYCLEGSNVNPVSEMVNMITTQKIYEANQKIITINDTIMGLAVNDIAKV